MRDVYACRLPLVEEGPSSFNRVLALLRRELVEDLGLDGTALDAKEGSLSPHAGVALRWQLLTAPGVEDRLWTLRLQRPHEYDAELTSHVNVDVALESGAVWVGVRLALRPTGHRVLPVRFEIRPPALVGAVVDAEEVVEDGWRLTREPAWAVDDDGVRGLAHLLLDPDRVLPVVVVTPAEIYDDEHDEYHVEPVVDPDAIAATLVGLAHVITIETMALPRRLTDLVGRQLSVFSGAVRLYRPEVDTGTPAVHPLWTPERLAEPRNQPFARVLLRRSPLQRRGGSAPPAWTPACEQRSTTIAGAK